MTRQSRASVLRCRLNQRKKNDKKMARITLRLHDEIVRLKEVVSVVLIDVMLA